MVRAGAHYVDPKSDNHEVVSVEGAPRSGGVLIKARYARAWIDVNREPYELDPAMFEDELPAWARAGTPRASNTQPSSCSARSMGRAMVMAASRQAPPHNPRAQPCTSSSPMPCSL